MKCSLMLINSGFVSTKLIFDGRQIARRIRIDVTGVRFFVFPDNICIVAEYFCIFGREI